MSKTGYLNYHLRSAVHCAPGAMVRLPALFQELGAKRVVLVSDAGLKAAGVVGQVEEVFHNTNSGGFPALVGSFTDITPNAGMESANEGLKFCRLEAADAILAVGGGSVLDAAKAIKYAMFHGHRDLADALRAPIQFDSWPQAQPIPIPHIAVPTTAGTGAEVSRAAVLLDERRNIKLNLIAPFIEADIALLDARVTLGLPPSLTASTGMDALTHALEAVASPDSNLFSDGFAFAAAAAITENLPVVVKDGRNVQARSVLLQASTMAITAFTHTLGGMPVHNFSHAFGGMFHIPHGDANAILLPIVFESLPDFYRPQAERLCRALNIETRDRRPADLMGAVVARIRELQGEIGCHTSMAPWGVKASQMDDICRAVHTDSTAIFYPLPRAAIEQVVMKAVG